MTITYLEGDATAPEATGSAIIVHICNDVGGWGRGFVVAVSKRWKEPERQYRAWYRGETGGSFALGETQLVQVEDALWVANVIGQRDIHSRGGKTPVRYDAIRAGLAKVMSEAKALGASVHMPRTGCGLAGGRWDEVEPIILDELVRYGVPVTVYDLPAR